MLSKLSTLFEIPDLAPLFQDIGIEDAAGFGVLIMLAVFLGLEGRAARNDSRRRKRLRESARANLGLMLFNDLALSLLSATSLLLLAEEYGGGGLLAGLQDPLACGVLAFVLLDLVHYVWHWANHRFDALWMFHRVHHSDQSMNASTAFRLHVMEVLLTVLVKAVFIVATGVHMTMVLFNEAIMALFVIFHHASLAVPGESWLGRVIIVPALHRVHHSTLRAEHDHNYGAVFSIWDQVFGTLAKLEPERLGIHGVETQSFLDLLKLGLTPLPRPAQSPASVLSEMIAEAAYFKAEKRGFRPGMEMLDWLDAEREIMDRAGH